MKNQTKFVSVSRDHYDSGKYQKRKDEIPFIHDYWSPLPKVKSYVMAADLFHLDGTVSKIEMIIPNITCNGDAYLLAKSNLETYICELTKYWLKIHSYQIYEEVIFKNGKRKKGSMSFPKEEVPLNKVYDFNEGWIDLPKPTGKIADHEMHVKYNF